MTKKLYPLKFSPIPKERVWGGNRLAIHYNRNFDTNKIIGESWDISGFEEDSSIVSEGYLEKNNLYDIMETYMSEIVGEDNYKHYGNEFPLLLKTLDIQDKLSLQVHPDDETAFDRHNSYGKGEIWYIMDTTHNAKIYMGFNRDVTPSEFYERCKNGNVEDVLNIYTPKKGDFFYIKAGTVHSADKGIDIVELEKLSDVTYRLYDWGRENNPAIARDMHLDLAFDCIDYKKYDPVQYFRPAGWQSHHHVHEHIKDADKLPSTLLKNNFCTVTKLILSDTLHIYTDKYESFIIYYCTEGEAKIHLNTDKNEYSLKKGEVILIPASLDDFYITPISPNSEILECYIEAHEEEKDDYIEE